MTSAASQTTSPDNAKNTAAATLTLNEIACTKSHSLVTSDSSRNAILGMGAHATAILVVLGIGPAAASLRARSPAARR